MASPCQRSLPGKLTARAQGGQATVGRSFHWARPEVDRPWGKNREGKGNICSHEVGNVTCKAGTRDGANHTGEESKVCNANV